MKGWAVVTGGVFRNWRGFARELSRRGYPVLAVARRRERMDALAMEASGMDGRIQPLVADLKTEGGLALVVRQVESLGDVALLVDIAPAGDFLGTISDRQWARFA